MKNSSLICVDIGNSNIDIGIVKDDKFIDKYFFDTKKGTDTEEYYRKKINKIKQLINKYKIYEKIDGIVLSSVVPELNKVFNNLFVELFKKKITFVDQNKINIKIKYNNPKTLGTDRIINILAAKEIYGYPSLVIDFGSATTFNCIDKSGCFIGGIIIPGINTWLKSLNYYTSKLPLINLKNLKSIPNIIGQSTQECIKSGIFFGYIELINILKNKIIKKIGYTTKTIITGGMAKIIFNNLNKVDIFDKDLTLKGLKIYWQQLN